MHICTIGHTWLDSKIKNKKDEKAIGGIGAYLKDLITFLMENNIKQTFIGKIIFYHPIHNLAYHEIQRNLTSTNKFLFYLFVKSPFIKIEKNAIIHAHRPDHLISFSWWRSNKCILTIHGQQFITISKRKGYLIRKIYKYLEKKAFRKASIILATDEITKTFYSDLYPLDKKKISVIPTGVNLDTFKPLNKQMVRKKYGYLSNEKIILYLGRLASPKRIYETIMAFAEVKKDIPDAKLILAGDGNQKTELLKLSESLGIGRSVLFLGIRDQNELCELINCADFTILISGNEGSPLSVKESLACGVPVIANCVGDIPLVVKNNINGYIVENDSIEGIQQTIKHALTTNNIQQNTCVQSIHEYDSKIIFSNLINIYNSLSLNNSINK